MEQTFVKDDNKVSILHFVAELIASKNNIVDIFNEIRNYLRTIIPCDYVTVLFNNEDSRYFSVIPAFNYSNQSVNNEIVIPYSETSITEILRSKVPVIRDDLNIRGNLTPGDLKFLSQGISSDLSVPIVTKNRVKAVINLSSYKSKAFTERYQTMVEEIAILLSVAIERIDMIDQLRDLKLKNNLWKNKYQQLLNTAHEAMAIINSEEDLIYESNTAFETLTGYSSHELNGMRYTALHPTLQNHIFNSIIRDIVDGKTAELKEYNLLRKDGQQLPVHAQFNRFPNESKSLILANYRPESELKASADKRIFDISKFKSLALKSEMFENFDAYIDQLLVDFGTMQKAKYIAFHVQDKQNAPIRLFSAKRLPADKKDTIIQPWLIGLTQGPFQEILSNKKYVKFSDIYNDPGYYKWIPIAQKLGYRSVISLPLISRDKTFGVLSFFYEQVREFTSQHITDFLNISDYFSIILDNYETNKELKNSKKLLDVINKITKTIGASLDLKEVIQNATVEIKKIIDFDMFLVTLFNDSNDRYEIFSIASETYTKVYSIDSWKSFNEKAELGWIDYQAHDAQFNQITTKLHSKINALLLARNKYLGTITLSSLEPNNYTTVSRLMLEKFAGHLAIAIENAKLFEEANKRLKEFASLAELSKSLNTHIDLDSLLKQIISSVAETAHTNLCSIRFIDNGAPLPGITATEKEIEFKDLISRETQEFIPMILEKSAPYFIENISDAKDDNENTSSGKYCSYLGVPIISREQIIAVLSIYWESHHKIDDREIHLISTIANHAASVIENARLYKETLRHSGILKKTNQELENFVYTVSHDLKTPIVSIQGFTSILLNDFQTILNEESYHYIKRIQSNANQMEALVKDLLELSRIGRVVSPFDDANIGEILTQVVNEQIYRIEKKNIDIVVQDKFPVVYCDKKRINQVFSNIIDNAIKYIGSSNPAPKIEIGYKDEIDSYLFYVKDNGIGIEKEYHQQIFGLFKGVSQEETEEGYSTGVGLAIVKRIIENHGGKVWVDSEPGAGATFFFTIPKKKY